LPFAIVRTDTRWRYLRLPFRHLRGVALPVSPIDSEDPPLYELLDVDALETAFVGSDSSMHTGDGFRAVEFVYRGHRIVVRSDGRIQVFETADP
jgi:hypothetical protein